MTIFHGSSFCQLRLHSCTLGIFKLGAKSVTPGEFPRSCKAGVRNDEGFNVGGARNCGKPPPSVVLGAAVHPVVVAPPMVDEQSCVRPGILLAAAVTWNVEIGSNASRYPSRIELLPASPNTVLKNPDLYSGPQTIPMLGPILVHLLVL